MKIREPLPRTNLNPPVRPPASPGQELAKTVAIGVMDYVGAAGGAYLGQVAGTALMQTFPAAPALAGAVAMGAAAQVLGSYTMTIVAGAGGALLGAMLGNVPGAIPTLTAIAGAAVGMGVTDLAGRAVLKPSPNTPLAPTHLPAFAAPFQMKGVVPLMVASEMPRMGGYGPGVVSTLGLASNGLSVLSAHREGRHDVTGAMAGTAALVALGTSLASLANPTLQPLADQALSVYVGAQLFKTAQSGLQAAVRPRVQEDA